jgi:hypothetical protein
MGILKSYLVPPYCLSIVMIFSPNAEKAQGTEPPNPNALRVLLTFGIVPLIISQYKPVKSFFQYVHNRGFALNIASSLLLLFIQNTTCLLYRH